MKKIRLLVLTVVAAAMFTGCQVKGECENCGKTAPLYKVWLNMNGEHSEDILCEECALTSMEFLRKLDELVGAEGGNEGKGYGMEKYIG